MIHDSILHTTTPHDPHPTPQRPLSQPLFTFLFCCPPGSRHEPPCKPEGHEQHLLTQ